MLNVRKMTILKARNTFEKALNEDAFEKNRIEYFKSMVDKAVGNGSVSGNVANLYRSKRWRSYLKRCRG